MIEFFRDTLDGRVYLVTAVICVFLILACIGYLVTKKIEEDKKKLLAVQPPQM
jgi:hypothetical protein